MTITSWPLPPRGRRPSRALLLFIPLLLFFSILLLHQHALYLPPAAITEPCLDNASHVELLVPEPGAHRIHALSDMWGNLTDSFHTNSPVPRRRLRPVLDGFPDWETFTQSDADKILGITPRQAWLTREAHQRVLDDLPDYSAVSQEFGGKGIVILAGGRYVHVATTTVSVIRLEHGCRLPIELWLGNDGPPEPVWLEDMVHLGVTVRSISDYAPLGSLADWFNPFRWFGKSVPWSQFQWKIMALLFSSFEEVLFLDADCIPARDPTYLFDSEAYRDTGVVIWPDYWESVASSWLPYLVGLTDGPSDMLWHLRAGESGEMLWNKRRHWKSLLLACYYSYHGANFWYTASVGSGPGWGDKDSFLLALRAAREDYMLVEGMPQSIGDSIHGWGVLNGQYSPDDQSEVALFHGAGGIKWSLEEFLNVRHRDNDPLAYVRSIFWARSDILREILAKGGRVFKLYPELEVDPEKQLWRGLEHVACGSRALGSERACGWVREKLVASLGVAAGTGSIHGC